MPRPTPFHSRTGPLCASQSWQEWSGYLSANTYELDHIHEYNAVRTSCGLFDISPLFEYHVRGRDAVELLNQMVTRDVSKCRVGQVIYAAWCDDDGKIIDDGTIARLGDDSFRLTAAIPTMHWLEDVGFGRDVELRDVSEEHAALALQGPTSRDLLQRVTDVDVGGLGYFGIVEAKVGGTPARISRTGYTGDLGYEIFVEAAHAEGLWDTLVDAGRDYTLRPAGNVALDVLRVEAGLLLIDVDFVSSSKTPFAVQKSTPYELGLGWMVNLKKPHFIGREALAREKQRGPAWATVGLEVDVVALEKVFAGFGMPLHLPYASWNAQLPVYAGEDQREQIGKATSGTWSPLLKKYVVIARVKPGHAALGERVFLEETVEGQRFGVPATVVKMPFFDPPRKKAQESVI